MTGTMLRRLLKCEWSWRTLLKSFKWNPLKWLQVLEMFSATLSIRLTRLKPNVGLMQPFRGCRGTQRSLKPRALPWFNTTLEMLPTVRGLVVKVKVSEAGRYFLRISVQMS